MNAEGYPDPTADRAIGSVSKERRRSLITGWVPAAVYKIVKPVLHALSLMGYDTTITIEDSDGKIYAVRMRK